MYCHKCGENNPDEAKFCKNCGARLKKEETVKKSRGYRSSNIPKETNSHYNRHHLTVAVPVGLAAVVWD